MPDNPDLQSPDRTIVLVTGANSGLGFSICTRLIDDFLLKSTTHPHKTLTVIFTTRSSKKASHTLHRLQTHLQSHPDHVRARVTLIPENVDLTNLLSVRHLSRRLRTSLPKLDSVILNAGLGGWTGINWPLAIWSVLTDLVHAVSWPAFKIASAGVVTDPQTSLEEEPRLGAVFCANVFGHYMLAHNVVPLLKESWRSDGNTDTDGPTPGRIIWVSSLEATINLFDVDDIQGLRSTTSYESSKALTDVLALTSNLPSSAPCVKSFYSVDNTDTKTNTSSSSNDSSTTPPNMYLTHPGICGSGILPLSLPLYYLMLSAFWLARFLGSPWHTVSTYLGACAPVWLALSKQSELDDAEAPYQCNGGGRVKWGSSCSRAGCDSPVCTEVDGWGFGGVVGALPPALDGDRCRRRKRGAVDLSREQKEEFEELGRKCWGRMEELRVYWDGLLDRAEGESQ